MDMHQNGMFMSISLTIPTATSAFLASGTWKGVGTHGTIGICICILLVVQNFLGAGARAYFRSGQGVP